MPGAKGGVGVAGAGAGAGEVVPTLVVVPMR